MKKQDRKSLTSKIVFGALLVVALHLAAAPAAMAMVPSGKSITGTVYVAGPDYFIMAESDDYLVVGVDLSKMVGMTVTATGWVSEGVSGKKIYATSVVQMPQ